MQKHKKRAALYLCILTAVLSGLFGGCTAPTSQPGPQEEIVWYGPLGEAAFLTDDLYFFLSRDKMLLSCTDVNTGVTIPLCNKVMCMHDDVYCEASIASDQFAPVFFWNDGLYYTEVDGYGTHLYRRNPDGTGLSRVATLCKEAMKEDDVNIYISFSIMADGKFYFLADIITVSREGDVLISNTAKIQICCVDLRSGKQTVIAEYLGDDNQITLLAASGNSVVYSLAKRLTIDTTTPEYANALKASVVKLIRADEKTKEQTVIFEKKWADFYNPKFFNGSILYYPYNSDANVHHRTAFDLNTGKETPSTLIGTSMINEEYGIKSFWTPEQKSICVVANKTDTRLPLELPASTFRLKAVSSRGLVLQMTERYRYDDAEAPHETTLYYIPISALPDGIQTADAVNIYSYRHH